MSERKAFTDAEFKQLGRAAQDDPDAWVDLYEEAERARDAEATLRAQVEEMRWALDAIAETREVARGDGQCEEAPALDAETMWGIARAVTAPKEPQP